MGKCTPDSYDFQRLMRYFYGRAGAPNSKCNCVGVGKDSFAAIKRMLLYCLYR
jgi:hypothetical protein